MVDRVLSRRVWPISVLAACLLVEALLLGVGVDDLDEGYFVQQATRVLHGQVPYRDFETLYTPGLAFLHAGVFGVLGGPSLIALRAVSLLARTAMALLLFGMARPLVRNAWWAALPGLVLLVGLDDAPVRWEPHPGWLSSLFAILAAWCLTHHSPRWLIASGVAAAAAYVFKQNTGVFILGAVLVWAWPRSVLPLASFGLVTLVWLLCLFAAGVHASQLGVIVGAVNQSGLLSAPEPTLAIPLGALLGGLWLIRRDSHPHLRLFVLAGCALLLTEFPRMDTLHLLWSTPLLLVVGAIALERAPRVAGALALCVVAVLVWPTLSERVTYLTLQRAVVDGTQAPVQTAADLQASIDDVRQRTRPGEPIFVYPSSPLLYVLADRPNATRWDHLNPGAASPHQIDQVIAELSDVQVVVVSDFWRDAWGQPGANTHLEEWIAAHYTQVARYGAYRILSAASPASKERPVRAI